MVQQQNVVTSQGSQTTDQGQHTFMCTLPNSSGSSHFSLNENDEFNLEAMEEDKVKGNEEEEEEECNNGKQRRRKTKQKANTHNTNSDNRNLDAMDVPMV